MSTTGKKIFSFLLGIAAGLGLFVAVAGELFRLYGRELPCRSAVCGQISRGPLNALPPLTPGVAAAAYFLLVLVAASGVGGLDKTARALTAPAVLFAGGLIIYTRLRYGAFCPACMAIASCVAAIGALELLFSQARGSLFAVVGACLGLGGGVLLGVRESHVGVDRMALSTMGVVDVNPPSARIGTTDLGPVLVVDFGCLACREEMKRLLEDGRAFAVRSVQRSEYDRASARYLSSYPEPQLKTTALRALLTDDALVPQSIARLPRPPAPPNEFALAQDVEFVRKLRIEATPTILVLHGRQYRLEERTR
jgi:uncharacterized membrane protein